MECKNNNILIVGGKNQNKLIKHGFIKDYIPEINYK